MVAQNQQTHSSVVKNDNRKYVNVNINNVNVNTSAKTVSGNVVAAVKGVNNYMINQLGTPIKWKKTFLVLLSLFVSSYVFAESPQLQYIKGMYELNVFLTKGSIEEDNDLNIYNHVDESFFLGYLNNNIYNINNIYTWDNKYKEITGDMACLDHDVLWQGQDMDPFAKLTFTEPSTDRVKVTIAATKGLGERSVTYQVKCEKDGDCKITEIFE